MDGLFIQNLTEVVAKLVLVWGCDGLGVIVLMHTFVRDAVGTAWRQDACSYPLFFVGVVGFGLLGGVDAFGGFGPGGFTLGP